MGNYQMHYLIVYYHSTLAAQLDMISINLESVLDKSKKYLESVNATLIESCRGCIKVYLVCIINILIY